MGKIPATLIDYLKEIFPRHKSQLNIHKIMKEICDAILKTQHELWIERCQLIHNDRSHNSQKIAEDFLNKLWEDLHSQGLI